MGYAILIKRNKNNAKFLDFDIVERKKLTGMASLEWYYNLIDCDTIEHAIRQINGVAYDLVFDEEFLFKVDENSLPTMIEVDNNEYIFGNVIVLPIMDSNAEDFEFFKTIEDAQRAMTDIKKMYLYAFKKDLTAFTSILYKW